MHTITFDTALKLKKKIDFSNAEVFFFNKTKERFYRKDLPTLAKDFHKLYTPAPGFSELLKRLPEKIKQGKDTYKFILTYDEAGLILASYSLQGLIDEKPLYSAVAVEPEDAIAELILKLKKHGKI